MGSAAFELVEPCAVLGDLRIELGFEAFHVSRDVEHRGLHERDIATEAVDLLVDALESLIDAVESPVDAVKPSVDALKPPVDTLKPIHGLLPEGDGLLPEGTSLFENLSDERFDAIRIHEDIPSTRSSPAPARGRTHSMRWTRTRRS